MNKVRAGLLVGLFSFIASVSVLSEAALAATSKARGLPAGSAADMLLLGPEALDGTLLPPTGTPLEALGDPSYEFPKSTRKSSEAQEDTWPADLPPAFRGGKLPPADARVWSVFLGMWKVEYQARGAVFTAARQLGGMPPGVRGAVVPDKRGVYQSWFVGLRRSDAERVCKRIKSSGSRCMLAVSR